MSSAGERAMPAPQRLDRPVADVLVDDRFVEDLAPGAVVGSSSTSGARRLGVDAERGIGIDNGRLRIRWLEHPGWGRAALQYGPFALGSDLVLAASVLNGLTTSQTDPRPEGRRGAARRWAATFPRSTFRRPCERDNLFVGLFRPPAGRRPPGPVAAALNRAGDDANGELWFCTSTERVLVVSGFQNLPVTYAVGVAGGTARLWAWSHDGAHGLARAGEDAPLAELEVDEPDRHDEPVLAGIHQSVLGEVSYRVDTRVDRIVVARSPDPPAVAAPLHAPWQPEPTVPIVVDDLGGAGDLDGSLAATGQRWRRVLGVGRFDRHADGVTVRASRDVPNPGRTIYAVPSLATGAVEAAVDVIPPGSAYGEGHRGRAGLAFWEDEDNHLVVNHFVDDDSTGLSISVFLRTRGHERMYDWDAVWSNVGRRIRHGVPFRLRTVCDGERFLCHVDDEPVLYRRLDDYRPGVPPLTIAAVGLVANWEWGDDTGSRFRNFAVHGST
jgi:hypothetical protein